MRRREGAVLTLRLARPAKRNALTMAMYAALADGLTEAAADPAIRAVCFAADGPDFCAGNDLADFLGARADDPDPPVQRFLSALATCPKILVAAVEGRAIGVGTTMLLHCDLVVAGETARFATPFVDLGLVPEAASSLLLPRLAGHTRAAAMLLLGETVSAREAHAMGIVSHLASAGGAEKAAEDLLARLVAKPETALLAAKKLMRSAVTDVAGRMAEERAAFEAQLRSPEAAAAIGAFFARRNAA